MRFSTSDNPEGCRTRVHEDLSYTAVKLLGPFVGHPQESLRGPFLCLLVREIPHYVIETILSPALAIYLVFGAGAVHKPGSGANIGFSLSVAVGFSSMILWWVRCLNEFEVNGNSLERIHEYANIERDPNRHLRVSLVHWPTSEELVAESPFEKYSADGPEIIHGLNLHISSGECVGVVGRTGSGKISLILVLLRCILAEGNVLYDGFPTSEINLDALRANIMDIQQVPELLSDTLRGNLDPFGQRDDATLNGTPRAAGLFSVQSEDRVGDSDLEAIVRRSKLLILYEAIDYEADVVVYNSLRTNLGSDTIIDADKIMVLDAGNIVQPGKPNKLLETKDGKLKVSADER
ncbi:P-loop containing nucleoside triphosphate hydrolase protein [Thelephora ganbajun]|uniref:P-loop containing nucleoside triphosphate hydrolase protein n=1 Tax=Thelephora ganbajun TaxID=370292 RepID=A0ACB6Z8X0_THEGA|nr:P-loop containing nucleoside triphosphate hydrolase protein [Thelephora ganbajun]